MTRAEHGSMGRMAVQVELTNAVDLIQTTHGDIPPERVRRLTVPAVVDARAPYLILSEKMATELGVPTSRNVYVSSRDAGRGRRSFVDHVRVDLLGRHGIYKAIVEPDRDEAVLGFIILGDLDLLVDHRTQTLQPRDPSGIIVEM
jgi:predicted aspartyl protease